MNIILGVISANVLINIISGITTTINGIYTIKDVISNTTTIGSKEVEHIMKEIDIEVRLKIIQMFLNELKITNDTPNTIQYCIQEIKNIINEIDKELNIIRERLYYNSKLWIGLSVRSYKFHNCKKRLENNFKKLDQRYQLLISVLSVDKKIIKNNDISNNILCVL